MIILSKSPWEESIWKLSLLLLKFVGPVKWFVVVKLVPLYRGGNEFGKRPWNKILVPFRGVLEIFRRVPRHFYREFPLGVSYSNYKAVAYDLVKQQIVEVASGVQYSSVQFNPPNSSHVICDMRYVWYARYFSFLLATCLSGFHKPVPDVQIVGAA